MADLFPCPVSARHPSAGRMNGVILSFPHSGRTYPDAWLRTSRLGLRDLRRSEDAFVDELISLGPDDGYAHLLAHFPRAWVDVNRHPEQLDPKLTSGLSADSLAHNPQVMAGLGVVPRVVAEGMPIYRHKLPFHEVRARLELAWHPYHDTLARLLANMVEANERALLVDCHSMPGPCDRTGRAPLAEIVIGDGHGSTCDEEVTRVFVEAFEAQGFHVARNNPYAGGYTVRTYGQRGQVQQAIQIEICRELYMDEQHIEKLPGFADISRRLCRAVQTACDSAIAIVSQ